MKVPSRARRSPWGRSPAALLLALALVAGCGDEGGGARCAERRGPAGLRRIELTSPDGRARSFLLEAPASALDGRPAPLVVLFHGVFADAETILAVTRFAEKARAEGFLLAAGDGVERSWNAGLCCDPAREQGVDDVGFARALVARVEEEYCVDPERVYATGFSNGAAMVFRLACEASDLFAAFAPVAGGLAVDCSPERSRPILVVNGREDPIVPFAVGEAGFGRFRILNGCSDDFATTAPAPTATCQTALGCRDEAATELCAIDGIGHMWPGGATDPGGAFDATAAVWDFLSGFPR